MIQIVLFVLAIALVYATKAAAILLKHDEIAAQSASFSWMGMRQQDEQTAASWAIEEGRADTAKADIARGQLRSLRHAGGASA